MADEHDSRTRPTEDDAGKDVIDSTGEVIGIVSAVEGGTIHVETDPGLTDSIKATLGWGDTEDTQTIESQHVAEIDDDAVHLAAEDPGATDVDTEDVAGDASEESTVAGDTGSGMGHEQDASTDRDDLPPEERRDDPVDGDVSGDETAAEMDDAGDVTDERTTGERGTSEMTDEGVSEREADPASDEMGVPAGEDDPAGSDIGGESMGGRDANERPPGAEDRAGREDVQDEQLRDLRGNEDVQDPTPDEPRDAEDVRDRSEELDPESEADPAEQPSTGEAATRGAEEDAELGREDRDDDRDR
ncbi:MAG: DUF2171 domain-containing protein [Halalkalicoccus sp.]